MGMKLYLYIKGKENFVHFFGNIEFKEGDYLVIPRGMIYTVKFYSTQNRLFIVESYTPVYTPKDIGIILVSY